MTRNNLLHVQVEGAETMVSFATDHFNRTDTACEITDALLELIEHGVSDSVPLQEIQIDFQHIDQLHSVGLNGLIGINSKARSCGVGLVLIDVQKPVRDLFALTRLERMFDFRQSEMIGGKR